MNLEEILSSWEKDSKIDDMHLDRESINMSVLHSKYLNELTMYKIKLIKVNSDKAELRRTKFRYYRGEMSKTELDDYGYQQWQGVKPMKSEADEYISGDPDVVKLEQRQALIKMTIETLDAILQQLRDRGWNIKNAISWKVFVAGG